MNIQRGYQLPWLELKGSNATAPCSDRISWPQPWRFSGNPPVPRCWPHRGRPQMHWKLECLSRFKAPHPHSYVADIQLGLLVGPEGNWSGCYPKSCCLYVGYVLLAGLPCLASMGEEAPGLTETCLLHQPLPLPVLSENPSLHLVATLQGDSITYSDQR